MFLHRCLLVPKLESRDSVFDLKQGNQTKNDRVGPENDRLPLPLTLLAFYIGVSTTKSIVFWLKSIVFLSESRKLGLNKT